jgi:hypothetical protein
MRKIPPPSSLLSSLPSSLPPFLLPSSDTTSSWINEYDTKRPYLIEYHRFMVNAKAASLTPRPVEIGGKGSPRKGKLGASD